MSQVLHAERELIKAFSQLNKEDINQLNDIDSVGFYRKPEESAIENVTPTASVLKPENDIDDMSGLVEDVPEEATPRKKKIKKPWPEIGTVLKGLNGKTAIIVADEDGMKGMAINFDGQNCMSMTEAAMLADPDNKSQNSSDFWSW